jgi:peptidoglycan/LPS O-acetylase OafA/YrhL
VVECAALVVLLAVQKPTGLVYEMLTAPMLIKLGQLSYGIYLYHNLAPIILGKLMFFLWWGPYADTVPQTLVRIALFAVITWGLTMASWKYIETPLNRMRAKKT